jgi:hypothetical protein
MLSCIPTPLEMQMPEQLSLFDTPQPNWAQQLHQRLDPQIRDRLIAILKDIAQAALHPPTIDEQTDPNER